MKSIETIFVVSGMALGGAALGLLITHGSIVASLVGGAVGALAAMKLVNS